MTDPSDPLILTAAERLRGLVNQGADILVLACLVTAGTVMFLPGVQKRWSYAAAAIVFGFALGYAVRLMSWPDGVMVIAVILGVVTGPVTAAAMHGKTIFEAIEEIQKARRGGDGGES